jgi:hypothetical protein
MFISVSDPTHDDAIDGQPTGKGQKKKKKKPVTDRLPAEKGRKKKKKGKKNVTNGHWTSFLSKLHRKRPAHRKRAKKKKKNYFRHKKYLWPVPPQKTLPELSRHGQMDQRN